MNRDLLNLKLDIGKRAMVKIPSKEEENEKMDDPF